MYMNKEVKREKESIRYSPYTLYNFKLGFPLKVFVKVDFLSELDTALTSFLCDI